MAKISEGGSRREQWFCGQGSFLSKSKPFWRPKDLAELVHANVSKTCNIDI
jgi:hypothetical protein